MPAGSVKATSLPRMDSVMDWGSIHADGIRARIRWGMTDGAFDDRLADVVLAVGQGLDLPDTLESILDAAVDLTGATYGALANVGRDERIVQLLVQGAGVASRGTGRKPGVDGSCVARGETRRGAGAAPDLP